MAHKLCLDVVFIEISFTNIWLFLIQGRRFLKTVARTRFAALEYITFSSIYCNGSPNKIVVFIVFKRWAFRLNNPEICFENLLTFPFKFKSKFSFDKAGWLINSWICMHKYNYLGKFYKNSYQCKITSAATFYMVTCYFESVCSSNHSRALHGSCHYLSRQSFIIRTKRTV